MNRFEVKKLLIDGVFSVTRQPIRDHRGSFTRLFCSSELGKLGWSEAIAQINYSSTAKKGTIRGLHYQEKPYQERKLITCIKGAVWDVAVDVRKESPTFLKWCAVELSAENNTAIMIPAGFAHGYQTLSDCCELLYLHSASYVAHAETGFRFDDPLIGIQWPMPITDYSDRDKSFALLDSN